MRYRRRQAAVQRESFAEPFEQGEDEVDERREPVGLRLGSDGRGSWRELRRLACGRLKGIEGYTRPALTFGVVLDPCPLKRFLEGDNLVVQSGLCPQGIDSVTLLALELHEQEFVVGL